MADITENVLSIEAFDIKQEYAPQKSDVSSLNIDVDNSDDSLTPEDSTSPLYDFKRMPVKLTLSEGTEDDMHVTFLGYLKEARRESSGKKIKLQIDSILTRMKEEIVRILMDEDTQTLPTLSASDIMELIESRMAVEGDGVYEERSMVSQERLIGMPLARVIDIVSDYKTIDNARHDISEGLSDLVIDEYRNKIYYIRRAQKAVTISRTLGEEPNEFQARFYTEYSHDTNAPAELLSIDVATGAITVVEFPDYEGAYIHGIAMVKDATAAHNLFMLYNPDPEEVVIEEDRIKVSLQCLDPDDWTRVGDSMFVASGESYEEGEATIYKPFLDGHAAQSTYGTGKTSLNTIIKIKPLQRTDPEDSIEINNGKVWVQGTGQTYYIPNGGRKISDVDMEAEPPIVIDKALQFGLLGEPFLPRGYNIFIPTEMKVLTNHDLKMFDSVNKDDVWNRKISKGIQPACFAEGWEPYIYDEVEEEWSMNWQHRIYLIPRNSENDWSWWNIAKAIELKPGIEIPRGWYAVVFWQDQSITSSPYEHSVLLIEQSKTSTMYRTRLFRPQIIVLPDPVNEDYENVFITVTFKDGDASGFTHGDTEWIIGQISQFPFNTDTSTWAEGEAASLYNVWAGGLRMTEGDLFVPESSALAHGIYFTGMLKEDGYGNYSNTRRLCVFFAPDGNFTDTSVIRISPLPSDCSLPEALSDTGDIFYYPEEIHQEEDSEESNTEEEDAPAKGEDYRMLCTHKGARYVDAENFTYEAAGISADNEVEDTFYGFYAPRRYINPDKYSRMGDLTRLKEYSDPSSVCICDGCISNIALNSEKNFACFVDRSGMLWIAKPSYKLHVNLESMSDVSLYDLIISLGIASFAYSGIDQQGKGYIALRDNDISEMDTYTLTDAVTFSRTRERSPKQYEKRGLIIELKDYRDEIINVKYGGLDKEPLKIECPFPVPDGILRDLLEYFKSLILKYNDIVEIDCIYLFQMLPHTDSITLDITGFEALDGIWRILGKQQNPKDNTVKFTLIKEQE